MAIPADLDTPLEFLNEDGTVRSKDFDDLSNYWNQAQVDALAKGVDSLNVKKFLDYIPARVFLPWLQALTEKANRLGAKALQSAEVVNNCLILTFADGSTYTSDSLKGQPAGNLDRFMLVLDSLDMSGSVVMQRIVHELGLSEQTLFNIFVPRDQAIYRGSYEDVLRHEAGFKMEPLMTFGGGAGIPYTEVEELPEASEEAKGIVYKVDGKFYTVRDFLYGDGSFKVGKKYGTIHLASGGKAELERYKEGSYALFDFECSYASGTVTYEASIYSSEGSFTLPGSEGGSLSMYDVAQWGIDTSTQYGGQQGEFKITGITELGAKVFGGALPVWKNFITGEEV